MKKHIAIALSLVLLFSIVTPVFASNTTNQDKATFFDKNNNEIVDIEVIEISKTTLISKNMSENAFVTQVSRNNIISGLIYVDFKNNLIRHEYADGTISVQYLSDIVTITKANPSDDIFPINVESNSLSARSLDFIDNEPLYVSEAGIQSALYGAPTYNGYQAMGYRGGYWYAPDIYGYLQRKNLGVVNTYYSHIFSFAKDILIETMASTIGGFYWDVLNNTPGKDLLINIFVSILSGIIDTSTNEERRLQFEVKRYQWDYRVRLNSDTGTIIYTNYRTQDYWKGYNIATGDAYYTHRGHGYDTGYMLSSAEMIRTAIDQYLGG